MKPFFSYYGSKFTGAKHYGEPFCDLVIEPFAGSACYSTYWGVRNVKLYDVSPSICELWDFLIHCSDDDIKRIPDSFMSDREFRNLQGGAKLLCSFWVAKGRAEPAKNLSPWYHTWKDSKDCRVWGKSVKHRILQQKPNIKNWSIDQKSFMEIETPFAHYHIDPPYNNIPGSRYQFSSVDYCLLAGWVNSLNGRIDVCENEGADWLPFKPLYTVNTSRGKRSGAISKEVLFRKVAND